MQEEDGVENADRYGMRGQRQFGVDLLIDRTDGSLWVGQCKSHQQCDAALIRTACDDFLKYANRWSAKGVTKFLLFLAADTRRTQLHDERLRQRERLSRHGFAFTVWSGAALTSKLRKQPGLVDRFLPYHIGFICGLSTHFEVQTTRQTNALLSLARQYGERVEGEHGELRRLWRDGYPHEALSKLRALKAEVSSWDILSPSTRAKLLYLEGRILLAVGNLPAAKTILRTTGLTDPSGRARLIAMIAQAEQRLDDAVAALSDDGDPDSQALNGAIHLQAGREGAALEILSTLHNHPDAHRLRAVISLSRGDVHNAKIEAERALALAPTWYWMRRTAATIRYLAGLSPTIIPRGLPEWPQPIVSGLLRQDNESVAARSTAAEEFRLLSDPTFHHSTDDLACIEAWHVACLVDNPDSRGRATAVAEASLQATPDNYRVMLWVLARDLPVTIDPSVSVLEAKSDRMQTTPEEVIALVAVHATRNDFVKARDLLTKTRKIFTTESAQALAELWQSQLQRMEHAVRRDSTIDPTTRIDEALTCLGRATANGDHLTRLDQCMTLAQLGRWDDIASVACDLVTVFQTPDAIRLASHALYNTGDVTGCLTMLGHASAMFFDGELSPDLRRLQVVAQRDAGAVPEAIRTAADEFEKSRTRDTFLELAHLYYQIGDFKTLALTARRHGVVSGLVAADYLTLSSCLRTEDPVLALTLWKTAVTEGLEDEHVASAFEIGSNLRADADLKMLAQRLQSLGSKGEGGIEAVGLEDLVQRFADRRQQLGELWQMLRLGSIPIHLVSQATGATLARVCHRLRVLTKSSQDGRSAGPIYQRFGGKIGGCIPTEPARRWRVNADVTGLLNAAHLGLLAIVEREFKPIRIPQGTVIALTAIQNQLRPSQPSRIEAKRQLLELVSCGRMTAVDLDGNADRRDTDGDAADDVLDLMRYGSAHGSLVLDFLPVRSMNPLQPATVLPDEYSPLLRDAHSVVDALLHCGALSKREHVAAIEMLGPRSLVPSDPTIVRGTGLVCRSGIALLLAGAGVLDRATNTFDIAIPARELDQESVDVKDAVEGEADAEWVGEVIERIRNGVDTGTYEFLPRAQPPHSLGEDDGGREQEVLLHDILACDGDDSDLVWIDDRCINSHRHSDGKLIVDTVDVLMHLKERHRLSQAELFDFLDDLRASDSRFIAFDAEELLSALREAPMEDGALVETRRLRVFRQYYARCLLEAETLRSPSEDLQQPNEWRFLLTCGSAVLNAMVRIWKSGSEQERVAQSEWLLRNMYTEDRGLYGATVLRRAETDVYRSAVSLAGLVVLALELYGSDSNREICRAYLDWLYRRVIRRRLLVDKVFAATVIERIKDYLASHIARYDGEEVKLAKSFIGHFWEDLPDEVRELTATDQEFLRTLGVSTKTVATIGPLQLETHKLWTTLARVLNQGRPIDIETVDRHIVTMTLESMEPIAFAVRCPTLPFDGRISRDEFVFLSESLIVRESGAKKLTDWFDVSQSRRDSVIATVVAGQDPGSRMDAAMSVRAASGSVFYREFAMSLRDGAVFRPLDIVPSEAAVLIEHLRIEETGTSSGRWENGIRHLLEDVGVVETAVRVGGLPVSLPDAFVQAVMALPIKERRRTLRRIRACWSNSPVGIVHLADLWWRVFHTNRRAVGVLRRFAAVLCDEDRRRIFKAWHAVLGWVDEQFGFNEGMRERPADVRLGIVWSHADRIFRILVEHGASEEWIAEVFEHRANVMRPEFVFPESAYSDDIAAPQFLRVESFVLAGLARICVGADRAAPLVAQVFQENLNTANEQAKGFVVAAMMADGSCATNVLESWLSQRREWLLVLPEALRHQFTLSGVTKVAIESCLAIERKEAEERSWLSLIAIVQNRPLSQSIKVALEKCLCEADLVDLAEREPRLATSLVNLIGMQAGHLNDDCRAAILEHVIVLACKLQSLEIRADLKGELSDATLNALVGCAWMGSKQDGEERAARLAEVLGRVAEVDPSGVFDAKGMPFVVQLCDTLPPRQARHFWRVREMLRLSPDNSRRGRLQ